GCPEVLDVRYQLIQVSMRGRDMDPGEILAEAESFIKLAPRDERGAELLLMTAEKSKDEAQRKDLYRRILLEYPASDSGSRVAGKLRQTTQIGMPLRLRGHGVLSDKCIHTEEQRGKVVLMDFWPCWCARCRGESPYVQ